MGFYEGDKYLFLTRHYPPNKNINGILVSEFVKELEKEGAECKVACIKTLAEGNNSEVEPAGEAISLRPFLKSRGALARFINMLYDGYSLVKQANKYPTHTLICTTSPPLLPFWAAILLKRKIKWGLWAFDLFPEGFAASKQVSEKNFIYRYILRKTYSKSPDFLIALGANQARFIKEKYNDADIRTYIKPAGIIEDCLKPDKVPNWKDESKVTLGYLGNVGDAHNPDFIKAVIDNIDNSRQQLILKVYGKHSQEIVEYAGNKEGVKVISDYISHGEMMYIDIHLVTLLSSWTHIAVPSKAVTAYSLKCKIMFCGNPESDNWQMVKDRGYLIDETKGDIEEQVKKIMKCI